MSVESLIKSSKVIFFDHDDTLVGTIETKWAQHKYVARRYYGKELSDAEIRSHWGKPFPEMICLLYGTDNTTEALANNAACHTEFPKKLFPATIPTLSYFHETGKLVGIITSTSRFSFEYDLTSMQIQREKIDYTQTADDTSFHKPNPSVFDPAIDWLRERHLGPSDVLYIGDGLLDYEAARGAGFAFIGVETGLVSASQFLSRGAISVASVGELIK